MIKFGPAGNDAQFFEDGFKDSLSSPKWVKELGLNAFEYSFGHGYQMGHETAIKFAKAAKENDIALSIHAPYYINFANPLEEMAEKSTNYILTGIKFLNWFGADHLVFHSGSMGKQTRVDAFNLLAKRFEEMLEKVYQTSSMVNIFLCPETMGKQSQIGGVEDILTLCKMDKCLLPTFDFGHINSLSQGSLKTKEDFKKIFERCFEVLGEEKTKNCHIHFSKIQFGTKGEIKHLTFEDDVYGPKFEDLIDAIIDLDLSPRIICESQGSQARDACIMQNYYKKNTRQN